MSVSTPILTLICWAWRAPQAQDSGERRRAHKFVFIDAFLRCSCLAGYLFSLNPEIVVQLFEIGVELGIGELSTTRPCSIT